MNLDVKPLPAAVPSQTKALLGEFRNRLAGTGWAGETPDTLLMPVSSSASSVAALEARLSALFRAHLHVLHTMRAGEAARGPARPYAVLGEAVQRFYRDWPVIGPGAQLPLEALLTERTAQLLYGRPDIVLTAEGPKVVETNFDTAVAGFERPDDMWTIAADLFDVHAGRCVAGRPLQGLRDYFSEHARAGEERVHWIMRNGDGVRQRYDAVTAELNRNVDGLRHTVHYAGGPPPRGGVEPGLLHRSCSVFSVNRDRDRFTSLLAALQPSVRACTVPLDLSQLSSKLYLAWLSDPLVRPASLSAEEEDAVRTLVPWTRVLPLLAPDDIDRLRRDRGEYVLKKADSHQAKEVHFGWTMPEEEWTALLHSARAQSPLSPGGRPDIWIVQQRVHPLLHDLVEITDEGAVNRTTGLFCCPYLMGGRIRGLETWLTPDAPDLATIHHMHFVPHFVLAGDGAGGTPG